MFDLEVILKLKHIIHHKNIYETKNNNSMFHYV